MRGNWEKLPYWLQGGVIGGGVVTLLTVLNASCLYLFGLLGSWGFECVPFTFLLTILDPIYTLAIPSFYVLSSIQLFTIDISTYFILGSLIGALIGYVKKRRE
ncbi:MAG: hypothetical protein HYW65_00095 [Candidatus Liptonbacteria bacterium]|nr:hypothetical protein [Candidatus Liptonbacteria bacterium]